MTSDLNIFFLYIREQIRVVCDIICRKQCRICSQTVCKAATDQKRCRFKCRFECRFKADGNAKKVLATLLEDGTKNAVSISSELGVSVRTIERALIKLQKANLIIRSGSKRDGKWIVVKTE